MALDIGAQLREWRKAANLDQDEVAEKLGVTQQTVSDWERNKIRPQIARAKALSELFGLPAETVVLTLSGSGKAERRPAARGTLGRLTDEQIAKLEEIADVLFPPE